MHGCHESRDVALSLDARRQTQTQCNRDDPLTQSLDPVEQVFQAQLHAADLVLDFRLGDVVEDVPVILVQMHLGEHLDVHVLCKEHIGYAIAL